MKFDRNLLIRFRNVKRNEKINEWKKKIKETKGPYSIYVAAYKHWYTDQESKLGQTIKREIISKTFGTSKMGKLASFANQCIRRQAI